METMTNAERLARINELDAKESRGLLQSVLKKVGPQPWFISVYRRVGPKIDPYLSRLAGGEWMKTVYGLPGMVLHTTGAKSGAPRSNPLLYVRDGEDFIVIGTNFGQPKHPAWTGNLKAHPEQAAIEVGGTKVPVHASLIDGDDWDTLFASLVKMYPGYALYLERRGDLPPRMFRLVPQV
jgi:deazaflavin-dependent oxidoreductase (nitroreductase family)